MKYKVVIPYTVYVSIEVEAENKEEAIEAGLEETELSSFCGNGGSDKLIGVCDGSIDIGLSDGDGIECFEIDE